MAGKRHYDDSCGIARALDLVGERWALLVVRELVHGPKRFTDLRGGLPGISADVLTQRLRDLQTAGIVTRRTLALPAAARVFELTEWGAELEPVLLALGRFGSRAALPSDPPPLSVDAAVMMLETTYRQPASALVQIRCGLVLGDDDRFVLVAGGPRLQARRDEAGDAAVTLRTDTRTLISILFGGQPLDDAIAQGGLELSGDRMAADELLTMFAAPVQVHA